MCVVHFLFLTSLRKTPCMASNIIRIGHTVCTTCCDGVNIPQYSRGKSKLTESWESLVVYFSSVALQRFSFSKKSISGQSLYLCVCLSFWAVGAGRGSCEPEPGWRCNGSGPGCTNPPPPAASSAEPLRNLLPCRSSAALTQTEDRGIRKSSGGNTHM